ncbi:type VI secretion system protein TssA [Cupriavidus campinensis]
MNTNASSAASRYIHLLDPVSADAACGIDLEYDPAFILLHTAAAPAMQVQYGDFVEAQPSVNWADAERGCEALLARTKDIRVAVILLRAAIRLRGAIGLRDGLGFLQALLERYGRGLHPLPYFDGEWDPLMFANALAALTDAEAALADVREISLPKTAGVQLQLRDIEKALAIPRQKDALAPESASRLLKELSARGDEVIVALAEAHASLARVVEWLAEQLEDDAPDLGALSRLLRPFGELDRLLQATPLAVPQAASANVRAEDESVAPQPPDSAAPADASGGRDEQRAAVMDRWTALATIRQVRGWFEDNEPSSPVVVMLRQAERLVGKRFSEVAQSIPFDVLAQWDAVEH